MIKQTIAFAVAALLAGGALAQTAQQGQTAQTPAPAADEPASPWAFNIGVVTDYRFRGISQTQRDPAIQGGVDYTHASGFYVGFWASSIRFIRSSGGDGRAELDLYGGYRGKAWEDRIAYDIGVLRYQYPNASLPVSPNTTEVYGALTYGPATLKYSHSVGDKTFGVDDSQGSYYLELAATFDTGFWGLAVTPHIGRQHFRHNGIASYTDYSIGVTKEVMKGLTASVTYVDTNADRGFYTLNGKYNGKAGVVAGVKYAF